MDITQLGNLAIFLPFRYYLKSIAADFRRSKTAILTISEALNLDFWKNFTLEKMSKISKNAEFRAAHMIKMEDFGC